MERGDGSLSMRTCGTKSGLMMILHPDVFCEQTEKPHLDHAESSQANRPPHRPTSPICYWFEGCLR